MNQKKYYEPEVSVHFLSVESGFASSGLSNVAQDSEAAGLESPTFELW